MSLISQPGKLRLRQLGYAATCLGIAAALAACTAVRVATHTVDKQVLDAPAGSYTLDPNHYSVLFDVDHLHYIRFVARFDRVRAQLQFDPDWAHSQVSAVAEAASIDTNVRLLDKIVAGDQMLDAQDFPEIQFKSSRFEPSGPTTGQLFGSLTVRGKTIPLMLNVTFNGAAPDPLTRIPTMGFSAQGKFSRAALGLATWFPAVGDDVNVNIQAEFVAQQAAQTQ